MTSKPIKILLIESDLEHAKQLKEVLNKMGNKPEVEVLGNLWISISRLTKGAVDLIILDLSLSDSQGYETYTRIRLRAPNTPIMLIADLRDESVSERAVKDGANCYLIKGLFDESKFINAVLAIIENPEAKPHQAPSETVMPESADFAKIISFIGARGGVGTTTVAINCALALAQQKRNVIAVELMSSYGTFSQQLNQAPNETLSNLLLLNPNEITTRDVNMRLFNSSLGMRVLFSPQKINEFKIISHEHAVAIIKSLGSLANYLVVDLPSYPTIASQSIIKYCSFVGLVVEREPGSIISAKITKDLLKSWGISGSLVGVIVVNRAAVSNPMKLSDIKDKLGCEIIGVVPPAPDTCLMALQLGAPIIVSQSETLIAATFTEIANRIAQDKVVAMRI